MKNQCVKQIANKKNTVERQIFMQNVKKWRKDGKEEFCFGV